MTRSRFGKSMPREATSVATQTRPGHRASTGERACARPGSSSPERATAAKPRSPSRLERRFTPSRVAAKHERAGRLEIAQHIDDRIFALGPANRNGAILDIGVLLVLLDHRNANGIALKASGERDDRFRHRRREHESSAFGWGGSENEFEVFPESRDRAFRRLRREPVSGRTTCQGSRAVCGRTGAPAFQRRCARHRPACGAPGACPCHRHRRRFLAPAGS